MQLPVGGCVFLCPSNEKMPEGEFRSPATLWTLGLEVQSPAECRVPRGRVFLCPSNKKMAEGEFRSSGNTVDARDGGAESR
ncbi:hypothetical protein NDU88_005718 [Pleurodeles waltl]|uniref:Uncharacterized protein n=1 Tax=Pleurodeles waltl TaxID=8319 RepID=A0AAV7TC44_PLEWA|nr:hypothetical protein NDU88_005718 [Pleurodeles waltl]